MLRSGPLNRNRFDRRSCQGAVFSHICIVPAFGIAFVLTSSPVWSQHAFRSRKSQSNNGHTLMPKTALRATLVVAIALLAGVVYHRFSARHQPAPVASEAPKVNPLWFQSKGGDNPVSAENDTPFPSSQFIVSAQWTTPRYYPNPKVQAADIIPVTWADDGYSYVLGDDGSVHGTLGTTVFARIRGVPPADNSVPQIDFELLAHDAFLYGCPKSVTPDSCYSVGLT